MPKHGYIAMTQHNSHADPDLYARETEQECIDIVHDFFLSYDMEVKDGRPYSSGNESERDPESGFKCFDNIKMVNGKVAGFMHCGGQGPVASVEISL